MDDHYSDENNYVGDGNRTCSLLPKDIPDTKIQETIPWYLLDLI